MPGILAPAHTGNKSRHGYTESCFLSDKDEENEGTEMKDLAVAFKNELDEAEINLVEKVECKDSNILALITTYLYEV